jgi:hypothetical protein
MRPACTLAPQAGEPLIDAFHGEGTSVESGYDASGAGRGEQRWQVGRPKGAGWPTHSCGNTAIKGTGSALDAQVGPAVWLQIAIRFVKLAQSLGQHCEFYHPGLRTQGLMGGA